MEFAIWLFAPRSVVDGILRGIGIMAVIVATYAALIIHLYPDEPQGFWRYFWPPFLTGAPWTVLILMIIRYLTRLRDQLERLAQADGLTGLLNRRAFFERAEAVGRGRDTTLLLIDADHFKMVNDTHGHQVGDKVLTTIAEYLCTQTRDIDLVGRLGGEEFGVLLRNTSPNQAAQIARRLTTAVSIDEPKKLTVTLSVGVASAATAPDFKTLFKRADQALYRAKAAGRARAEFWTNTERPDPGPIGGLLRA